MQVRFYATLRAIVGQKTIEVATSPGVTVMDLARILVDRYPGLAEHVFDESGDIASSVHFMVDGRSARWLDGADTVISEGQSIDVFPPVAGG